MFKKNIIAIAIVTLGLVMASNAFGQERPKRPNKNDKPKKADSIIKPMYVANQEEYMAGGIADVRGGPHDRGEETKSRKKQSNSAKSNTQNKNCQEFEAVKSPRDVASGQATGITEVYEAKGGVYIKSPRDFASGQATGKRQHKPIKSYNLGDTATHERRKQRQ